MQLGKEFQMEGRMQTKLWRPEGKVFYILGYIKREVREKFGVVELWTHVLSSLQGNSEKVQ